MDFPKGTTEQSSPPSGNENKSEVNSLQKKCMLNHLNSLSNDELISIISSLDSDKQEIIAQKMNKEFRTYCFGSVDCSEGYAVFEKDVQYDSVSKEQLPYKIMRDDSKYITCRFSDFFNLHWTKLNLQQYEIFKDFPVYLYHGDLFLEGKNEITSEHMEYLYTKILKPSDLLKDIKKVMKKERYGTEYFPFFADVSEMWKIHTGNCRMDTRW